MMVYAITDTKKGEQGLRLLIFKLPVFVAHCTAHHRLCDTSTTGSESSIY